MVVSNDPQQYYQQLITISTATTGHTPSYYGLNSADSNFQITTSSGTPLYTWIQSYNSTSLTMWTKTPYSASGSETLQMQVFPQFENLFSANGYLGYGRDYFNAPYIFPFATDFADFSGWNLSGLNGGTATTGSYGLRITPTGSAATINSNLTFSENTILSGSANIPAYGGIGLTQDYYGNGYTDTGWFSAGTSAGQAYDSFITDAGNDYGHTAINGVQEAFASAGAMGNQTFSLWHSGQNYWIKYSSFGLKSYSNDTPVRTSGYHIMIADAGGNAAITIPFLFVQSVNDSVMPTASISGSGSAFMANATTTNTFPGMPGKMYNSTWQYITYNIDVGPTTNYTTVIYNESWAVAGIFPSSYKVFASIHTDPVPFWTLKLICVTFRFTLIPIDV